MTLKMQLGTVVIAGFCCFIAACSNWARDEPTSVHPIQNAVPIYIGCFNTTDYMVEKNFSSFLSRRLQGQTTEQCLQWCLSQNFKPRLRSIFVLHDDRCVCTKWSPPDLPYIEINEIDDRYCTDVAKGQEPLSRILTLYMFCQHKCRDGDYCTATGNISTVETTVVANCAFLHENFYPPPRWFTAASVGSPGQTPLYECFRRILEPIKRISCVEVPEAEIRSKVIEVFSILTPTMGSKYYFCRGFGYDAPLEFDLRYSEYDADRCERCAVPGMIPMLKGPETPFYCGKKDSISTELVSIYSRKIKMVDVCGLCEYAGTDGGDQYPEFTFPTPSPSTAGTTVPTTSSETVPEVPEGTGTTSTEQDGGTTENTAVTTERSPLFENQTARPIPPGSFCESAHCRDTDAYGIEWCANLDHTVQRPCIGNSTGVVFWECTANGFRGVHPNYMDCKSVWLQTIVDLVEQDASISPVEAGHYFGYIHQKCQESVAQGHDPGPPPYYPHEIKTIFDVTADIVIKVDQTVSLETFETLGYVGVDVMRQVFVNQHPWRALGYKVCSEAGTSFLLGVERSTLELTRRAASNDTWMTEHDRYRQNYGRFEMNMTCGAQIIDTTKDEALCYPFPCDQHRGSFIRLPPNWAEYFSNSEDVQFVGLEILANYTNFVFPGILLNRPTTLKDNTTKTINGNMMTFSVDSTLAGLFHKSINFTGKGVTIGFQHEVTAWGSGVKKIRRWLHPGEVAKPALGTATCVYWDTNTLAWSSEGCTVVSTSRHFTLCECSHLSSFAVLFSVHEYIGKNRILEILTWMLSSLSSVCLVICIMILSLSKSKSPRSPRNEITVHLCVNLLIGNLILLLFMDKNYFDLGLTMCAISGAAIHFFFLSAFCWMTIEAFQLYRMVIVVFDSGKDHRLTQRILAYGIPSLIVICTLSVATVNVHYAYGGDEFCWLQDEYIWAFCGPIAFFLTVNFGILVACLRKVKQLRSEAESCGNSGKRPIGSLLKGSASLTCLLGLCWISGFFMLISPNPVVAEAFAFAFTILNASQGFLLFVFHFALNLQVQEQIKLRLRRWIKTPKESAKSQVSTLGGGSSASSASSAKILVNANSRKHGFKKF